ncbi:hypothetical protein QAD02_003180 [Eretmocerus hayati]|uniref:Uncharacterized protein n=1 Tax=Eretmocerus hayati TaxID=131215 RepID=A0ACC2NMS4_9HYME|nr:hypothetical protein QAD02_003180 [Eretmocerus hayati]
MWTTCVQAVRRGLGSKCPGLTIGAPGQATKRLAATVCHATPRRSFATAEKLGPEAKAIIARASRTTTAWRLASPSTQVAHWEESSGHPLKSRTSRQPSEPTSSRQSGQYTAMCAAERKTLTREIEKLRAEHPRERVARWIAQLTPGTCVREVLLVASDEGDLSPVIAIPAFAADLLGNPRGALHSGSSLQQERPRAQPPPQGQPTILGGRSRVRPPPRPPRAHRAAAFSGRPPRGASRPIAPSPCEIQPQPQSLIEVGDPPSSPAPASTDVEILAVTPRSYSPTIQVMPRGVGGHTSPPLVTTDDGPAISLAADRGAAPVKKRKRVLAEQVAGRTTKRRPERGRPGAEALIPPHGPDRGRKRKAAAASLRAGPSVSVIPMTTDSVSRSPTVSTAARAESEPVDLDLAVELLTEYRDQGYDRDPKVAKRIARMLTSDYQQMEERARGRRRRAKAKTELNMLSEEERQQRLQQQRAKRQAYRNRSRIESSQDRPSSAASSTGSCPRSTSLECAYRTGSSTPGALADDIRRPASGAMRRPRRRTFCFSSTSSSGDIYSESLRETASPSVISTTPSIEVVSSETREFTQVHSDSRGNVTTVTQVNTSSSSSGSAHQAPCTVSSGESVSVTESAETVTLSMADDGSVIFTTEVRYAATSPSIEAQLADMDDPEFIPRAVRASPTESGSDTDRNQGTWLDEHILRIGEAVLGSGGAATTNTAHDPPAYPAGPKTPENVNEHGHLDVPPLTPADWARVSDNLFNRGTKRPLHDTASYVAAHRTYGYLPTSDDGYGS